VATKDSDRISRDRWNWMKRYRVWEANRQVYLYPENWIVPSLRDDKTSFFLNFESNLQQKDVSLTNAVEGLKTYIYNVAAVANMRVYGLFVHKDPSDSTGSKFGVHIVACRTNAPFDWYSRDYSNGFWSPWVRMQIDIPTYDVDSEDGDSLGSGSYVSPFPWQGQPILYFLQMVRKTISHKDDGKKTMMDRLNTESENQRPPWPVWDIRLGYSLFQNGKWSQKQLSKDSLRHKAKSLQVHDPKSSDENVIMESYVLPNQVGYQMVPRAISDSQVNVDILYREGYQDLATGQATPGNIAIGTFAFVDGGVAYVRSKQSVRAVATQ
jgi:Neuraminidase-like domain